MRKITIFSLYKKEEGGFSGFVSLSLTILPIFAKKKVNCGFTFLGKKVNSGFTFLKNCNILGLKKVKFSFLFFGGRV